MTTATKAKPKRAKNRVTSKAAPPAPKQPKRRAGNCPSPIIKSPAASTNLRDGHDSRDTHIDPAIPQQQSGETEGHVKADTRLGEATVSPAETSPMGKGDGPMPTDTQSASATPDPVAALRYKQAQRVATIRMQIVLQNKVRSFARLLLRWEWIKPEEEREKINAAAAALVDAIENGEPVAPEHAMVAEVLRPHVVATLQARTSFDAMRKGLEKEMRALAESLPAYERFVKPTPGLASLGLAMIVGEAGDVGSYANPGKLWKRMGVAPDSAYAMETKSGKTAVAKPRRRRSELFKVGDSLLKTNRIKVGVGDDDRPIYEDGYYRQLYLDRKAYEQARAPEMTKMHAHRRAQRYMEKRLLLHLWKAWTSK